MDYDVRIHQLKTNNADFASTMNKYDGCQFLTGAAGSEELSSQHFQPCGAGELDRLLAVAVFDPEELRQLEMILSQHRMAVVVGPPDVGKGTLARLAAARLCNRSQPPYRVAETSPLGNEVRAPLLRLIGPAGKLGSGILLFRDFLATEHRDLLGFLGELDPVRLGSLTERLRAGQTFLLFTSDIAHLNDALPSLGGLGLLHETSGPAKDQLRLVLTRRAEDCLQPPKVGEDERQRVREFLAAEHDRITGPLRTPPRVVRFVERYLLNVAMGRMSLEHALDRLDDLADWLLCELATDLDTWSFALALVLAQPHPHPASAGAPWQQVHALARAIARHLRRVLREPRDNGTVIADESRLERLHAEVRRLPFPGVDVVRFKDDSYPERLWQVLLGPGREILSILLPLLQKLAADPDSGFAVRFVAARALGRCGEMDAFAIAFPVISAWSRSSQEVHHLSLGHLLQGVLASSSESFRGACLGQLWRMTRAAKGGKAWAPAVALREVGSIDQRFAIEGLILLADCNLEEEGLHLDGSQRESLRRMEDDLRAVFLRAKHRGADPPELGEQFRRLVLSVLCNFEREPEEALVAVQYALVGLCFYHGPLSVLRELAVQLAELDGGRLAPLLALLMLRHGGIVDLLERNPSWATESVSRRFPSQAAVSRFLVAASSEPQGPHDLVELLVECYLRCDSLPGTFARSLRSRLLDLLRDWARKAADNEALRPVVKTLLWSLLRCRAVDLKEEVFRVLHSDPEFSRPGSGLARLAGEILVGQID